MYNNLHGEERRIGVNGGRGERAYNSWTCSFVKERRKRERGSESRSRHHECCWHSRPHVTSPFHVQVPRRRAVPSTPPLSPRTPRDIQCTRAKRGTNHEARRTQNILKLGFYTFEFHGTHTTPRSGLGREKERTKKLDRCIASDMSKPLFVVLFYLKPLRCGEKSIGRL